MQGRICNGGTASFRNGTKPHSCHCVHLLPMCTWTHHGCGAIVAPYGCTWTHHGCGAIVAPYGWLHLQWPESWSSVSIATKELVPIVVSATSWGNQWAGQHDSDNMAVVSIFVSRSSAYNAPTSMSRILHCLAEHVPGNANIIADALSRNNLPLFFSLAPQVPQTQVSPALIELLVTTRPDWGSQDWTSLFLRTLHMASRCLPRQPTFPVNTATSPFVPNLT